MKILILKTSKNNLGGVANFYNTGRKYFNKNIKYLTIGRRQNSKHYIGQLIRLTSDYLKFFVIISTQKINLVVINPSLGVIAIKRDSIFIKLINLFSIPWLSFIHGWDKDYERKVEKSGYYKKIVKTFNKASAIWVLSSEFKNKLIDWGIDQKKIIVETTMVDDQLLNNFSIKNKIKTIDIKNLKILFLGRIVKEKGVFETIEAFEIISKKYPFTELIIAGDGPDFLEMKNYVNTKKINNIKLPGFVSGQDKINLLKDCHIFLFPTYGEGLPICVLEAMAFGMPVITRKVGGLKDFFENEKMGYITDSLNPEDYADYLLKLLNNIDYFKEVSKYNYEYAQKRFLASKVTKRIEAVFKKVIKESINKDV